MTAATLATVAQQLLSRDPDACVVSTCGYPSRELYNAADRPGNFYLLGSMGMAGPVALGIATARPRRLVIAIDGDGSLLMNLGVLTMIAASGANLIHVVCDNGMHESTGGQLTTQRTDFAALALAAGYRSALQLTDIEHLATADLAGTPALLHVLTPPRTAGVGKRVQPTPQQLVQQFRSYLT